MKFTCDKNVLIKEIGIAQEIISTKNAISILSNIYLEAVDGSLIIKATDMKVNFQTRAPVNVIEEGSTTVLGDKFLGILNAIPDGELEFSQDGMKCIIKPIGKKIKFQLKSIASEKFPEFTVSPSESFFEMPIKDFKEMIGQTIFAVSDDETRFNMNGLYLEKASVDDSEKLIMVSTDGRRMSYCEKTPGFKIPDFPGAIIPVKIMNIVQKRAGDEGNIQISISDKMIFIKFGSYELSSVLIDGNYPEYRRVIPEGQTNSFIVNAGELLEALKRVAILVEQKTRRIFLNITSSGISVRSDESDIGDAAEEIACQYSGEDIAIALNYRYIEEPIKALASEEVQVWFTTPGKPLTIKPVPEADYFHIVMPIHLD